MSIRKQVAVKWGLDRPVTVEAYSSGTNDCVLFGVECGNLEVKFAGSTASMRSIAAMLNAVADEMEGRQGRRPEPSRAVLAALADEMEPE